MPGPEGSALPAQLDWSPFAQQIVDDAHAVLGFPVVLLSRFDRAARTSMVVAWGGLALQGVQRALREAAWMAPSYDALRPVIAIDRSPLTQRVFAGEPVRASTEDFCRGITPAPVARIAGQMAGAAYGLALPLCVDGRVLGSLACFQRRPTFSDVQLRTAQAFARQVALSIHNAELLDEQRRSAAALDAARRLIAQAEDRTRRDISEYLHSRVQSRLLVAETRLAQVGGLTPQARSQLDGVRAELRTLREQDIRLISHQLHPEALALGLLPAVQVLAGRLSDALRLRIITDEAFVQRDSRRPGLGAALKLTAFRIIEESVGNALKHARAREVTVLLHADGGQLNLEVVDDGQGFDPQHLVPGLGLLCLGARIDSAGGLWTIESRIGGPTRVKGTLPA